MSGMKGSVGITTSVYRAGLPRQWTMERMMAEEWNYIHDHARRHRSLGYLTPAEFLGQRQEANGCGDDVSTT